MPMSNSGDNSRSSTPSDSLHDGPGQIQSTSTQRPRKKYPKKRRLHPDRARVMSLLPEYDARGITNRDEISKRLKVEHQIDMSAPTIARLRRELCLVKRPMPTQGLSWKEKEIRVMNNMFRKKFKFSYPQEDPKTKKRMWKVCYLEERDSNYDECDYWDMDKSLSSRDEDSEEGNDNEKIKFKRGRKLAMIRPTRIIQDRLKEGKDGRGKIHIPLEEISKILKRVKECKTGPDSEWRIEIYQPIPELEVWLMGIWDVWSEGWLAIRTIVKKERLQNEVLYELLCRIESFIMLNRITIKLPDEEPRDFEPANIREFLFANDISVEETLQKLSTAPAYPIIKGELPKGSRTKLSEMLERWRDGISILTAHKNLNLTDFRHRSLITECWEILLEKERDDLWESESRREKYAELGLSDDSYDGLFDLHWCAATGNSDGKLLLLIKQLATPLVCKEIRRFHEVWVYLYSEPKPFCWSRWECPLEDFINLSNVWNIVEKMLPSWEKQFEHDEHGEWTLTKEFIDPRRETSSSLPYSNTPPTSEVTDASAGLMLMELARGYSTVPEQEFYPNYGHSFMPNTSGPIYQPQMQMMPSYNPEGGHVDYANPGPAYSTGRF